MVLQKMRAGAQGIAAKILVGMIVFVLAVFGFGAFDLFSVSEPIAATVNGTDITQRVLDVETTRLRSQYGEGMDPAFLDQLVSRKAVLEGLVDRSLLSQAADDLALVASDAFVQAQIREMLAQQLDIDAADLDQTMYRNLLANAGYTPSSFHAERAEEERRAQLQAGLRDTAFITQRDVTEAARIQFQRRDIAWLLFDVASHAADVEVADAEIEEHYGEYLDDYMTEERFDFDYVRLPRTTLEDDIEVDEEAVLLAYQNEIDGIEPRRHAAHILLETGDERSVEQAVETLTQLRAEIAAGASFAERARELSDDPGSAAQGGDLGPAAKGVYVPAFEAALWALEPGELSQPVETEFGVHLVQLLEIKEPEIPTLDERRDEIIADLRRDDALLKFESMLRDMDELAFEQPDSLDALAGEYDLAVETVEGVSRSDRDGIFSDPGVRDALFSDEVLVQGFNSRAVATAGGEAVVGRLRTRHPATERPLTEVRDEIRDRIARLRGQELAEQAAAAALSSLAGGDTPAAAADQAGVEWQRADGAAQTDADVPRAVLTTAFTMAAPATGEREIDIATLADDSRAVVLLSNVTLGDYATLGEAERNALATSLTQLGAARDAAALIATLRAEASIEAIDFAEGS